MLIVALAQALSYYRKCLGELIFCTGERIQ